MFSCLVCHDDVERRVKIFEDTMIQCRDNKRLAESIKNTLSGTKIYKPGFKVNRTDGDPMQCSVTVTKERTFECADRLRREYSGSRVAVLNFASATNPGGGVKSGSGAQEECLCRCSTLFRCIDDNEFFGRFYGMHRNRRNLRYTDTCIYSPDITVFKSDTAFPAMKPESEWFQTDVITCAAPNLRKMPYNKMNPGSEKPISVSDEKLLAIHKQRGSQILSVAADNKADILVLGAFGCGAFQNNPRVVAQAYKEILPKFKKYFKAVCFAVFCPPGDSRNYNAFEHMLCDRKERM